MKFHDDFQEPEVIDDAHLSLPIATRRSRRVIQLPARFADDLPENLQSLPPGSPPPTSENSNINTLESPCNKYGLFRRYFATSFPSHDPDSELTMHDCYDVPSGGATSADSSEVSESVNEDYGPYPNRSSFLLGEWNWNEQVQKSKSSFQSLVNIITDPNFCPSDICDTRWDTIDSELGSSDLVVDDFEPVPQWIEDDSSWTQTPITISVPFHRYNVNPGPRDYTIPDFYHRGIVSILQEALSQPLEGLHFHYEPYELYWQRASGSDPIRVYGELYTSPAFLHAHQALQASLPEPGCQLPRIVAGLMLASDATHVTSFGDTKIWPQYLFFGNQSKYRRCKPTLHLCHHVAYFQKVSLKCYLIFNSH